MDVMFSDQSDEKPLHGGKKSPWWALANGFFEYQEKLTQG